MRGRAALLCILFAVAFLAAGCRPLEQGRDTPPDPLALVDQGRALLSTGDAEHAAARFQEALVLDPALDEARYGLVLAKTAGLVVLVDDFANLIAGQMAAGAQSSGDMKPLSDDGGIGYTIDHYVHLVFLPTVRTILDESEKLYESPDAEFQIDTLPISWGGKVVLDLGGRWNHSEAALLLATGNLLQGVFDALLARDLDFDLGHVFALPIDWTNLSSVNLASIWRDLVHMAIEVLADPNYPNFLGLTDEGLQRMPAAGVELGLALKYVAGTGWLVRQDPATADCVIGWVDSNGDGVWEEGEPLRLPGVGVLTDTQTRLLEDAGFVANSAQDSLLDGTAIDPWPDLATPFDLASANPLVMDLTGWGFGPIPHTALDLGGMFARPNADPTASKQAVVQFLSCIDQNEALPDMLRCWVALYGGSGT